MELYDVMRTTFAAREFTADEVPDSVLETILDNARFAPSGGNRQGWRVIVVRDQKTRDALPAIIAPAMQRYVAQVQAGESPWNTINDSGLSAAQIEATKVPDKMIQALVQAPVLLFVFLDLSLVASFDKDLDRVGVISGASIYPFVWNILLAARNEGYGGTPTTFAGAREDELKTLLGVPEHFALGAMIPMGKPLKQLTRLSRNPVESFVSLETFNGNTLGD